MTNADDLMLRVATPGDAPLLKPLIEGAYRGDNARLGWTHEADIVEGERIAAAELDAMLHDPHTTVLIAADGDRAAGCVAVTEVGAGLAYLGTLCVNPARQSGGLGSRLLEAGEDRARDMGMLRVEMTVIENREPLIAWYLRKGYRKTGESRPFPTPQDPPIFFTVLEKAIAR